MIILPIFDQYGLDLMIESAVPLTRNARILSAIDWPDLDSEPPPEEGFCQLTSNNGTYMKNRIKKRRFYFRYQQRFRETKWLETQVRYFDPLQLGNEVWGNVVPVGREFGAAGIKKERRTD